jgi:hypothetical protein
MYITPRVLIQQEFLQLPVYSEFPLPAFIIGPNYSLLRYSEPNEKNHTAATTKDGVLLATENNYIADADTSYDFPNVPAGGNIDPTYTKVYAESVEAQYFPLLSLGSDSGDANVELVPSVSGGYYRNKVRFTNLVMKTANNYVRSELLSNRDVAVGDVIEISDLDNPGDTASVVRAKIKAIEPETYIINEDLASYVEDIYNNESNTANQSQDYGLSGSATGVTVDVNEDFAYIGYAGRKIVTDTYTVTVTVGGSLTAARFSISSDNGAFKTKTNVALSAGVLTLDDASGNNVKLEFSLAEGVTFTAATVWTLNVEAAVTQVTPTVTGTYSGEADIVYTLTVERGGAFYDGTNSTTCARILVKSSIVDTASLTLPRKATPVFQLGGLGLSAVFSAGSVGVGTDYEGLVAGDVYYVSVVAAKHGAVTIVEFAETLPDSLFDAANKTASLFLTQNSIQLNEVKNTLTDTRNWTQDEAYVTVNSGATTSVSSIIVAGSPAELPIKKAKLFIEYRALLQNNIVAIDSVRSQADVLAKLGTIHPDNPLAQGVNDAVLNAANQLVYFIGVATDDLAGYLNAIKISEKSDKVYGFVPLTFDRTIQDAVVAHVNAYSTREVGRWRVAWLSVQDNKERMIYDSAEYTATVTNDLLGRTRLLTIENAKFIEDGVRANDSIRINFSATSDGKLTYDEYIVDSVQTNTTLLLTHSLPYAITPSGGAKVQVVRNYTKSERAYNLAKIGGDYNNRRVRCVFPDTFKYKGVTKQGYFAAAGLAGLRSGVVPHQGLTNSEYLGADDLSKVVIDFSQDELNVMAEQGIWIITQEVIGSTPYVRHQLTTDERSLNTSEDSITTNVDSISYALKKVLSPFIGRFNINPDNVAVIRAAVVAELTFRSSNTYTARAGNQLVSFTPATDIIKLEANPTFKDMIDIEVRLNVPYPINYINLKLIVG